MKLEFGTANKEQLEAINAVNGPVLIIAGPGTGKTFTLINRTLNLIVNHGVKPSEILLATFTEKAAKELVTRLSFELDKHGIDFNPNEMYVGTFHSICLRIIKDNVNLTSLKKNFKLYDQFDQQYFIYRNFSTFKSIQNFDSFFATKTMWDKCEEVMKVLNRLAEELVDYRELKASSNAVYRFYGELLEKYEELRVANNFLDFSSIQVEAYRLFQNNPQVLSDFLNRVKYLMIDEYQDTNHIQEALVLLLAGPSKNVCVVGDDDQAIYRFRGATVRNILEFPMRFEGCKKVELVSNYRSNADIVRFYNDWMDTTEGREFKFDWGRYRYGKAIIPAKAATTSEPSVIQLETKEKDYLEKKTLKFINALLDSGSVTNLNQIAFLFRSVKSEQTRALSDYLEKHGIPVYSPRSNMFFERKEILTMLGLLLLMFPKYIKSMDKLSNGLKNPMEGYYKLCLDAAKNALFGNPELLAWLRSKIKNHIYEQLKSLDYGFSAIAYEMLQFEPFKSEMDIDLNQGVHDTRTVRNISTFVNLLVKFEALNNLSVLTYANLDKMCSRLFNTYLRFLFDGGITEYEDESEYAPSGCVSFLTIHQSKGLEFPIVVIGSQSATPRKQYDEDIENIIAKYSGRSSFEPLEEIKMFDFWRLFYVAFSRAQSLLVLLCDSSKSNEPSKYFEGFYESLPRDPDYSKFKFEQVKNSKLKNSYSFTSDINVYLTCPTQYKFYKELGFDQVRIGSTLFGTVVHETIEDIHKAVLSGKIADVNDGNIEKWLELNYKTASKAQNSYLSENVLKSALDQVKGYVGRAGENWNAIANAEMPITLSEDKFIITGKVDLVTNDKGEYQILDFKTEKKPNLSKESEKVERVQRQLEIYAYLFEKRYGISVTGMKVYYTGEKDGIPTISFKKDDRHINDTVKTFRDVVDKIEKKDFNGQCNNLAVCKNCDLRHYCKKG